MYTEEMAKAFHEIEHPEGFSLDVYDNGQFITLMVKLEYLENISQERGVEIVDYINKVKTTLESLGGIVLVVREEIEE
jgi:hypothetical protein